MQLQKISKKGTMHFKLSDNRVGIIYANGYVRVSCKDLPNFRRRGIKLYQINKKIKNTKSNGNYYYTRELIPNLLDQLTLLYTFNLKNCK
jgi:hypothetical protein